MKLYAYFVSDDPGVHLAESIKGVGGSAVRLMKADELIVCVSETDGEPVAITRENIVAHERVVRSVLERITPLPFRFGSLVGEAQLRSYLHSHQAALQSKLLLLRGCVEMSVKVIWQASGQGGAETKAVPVTQSWLGHPGEGAGAAFLMAKRREIVADQMLADKATEIASWLRERLGASICKDLVSLRPRDKLVLAAAHLVARSSLERYRGELNKARAERPDLHFLSSGPWPPYSFVNIDLEFKTHFGVS